MLIVPEPFKVLVLVVTAPDPVVVVVVLVSCASAKPNAPAQTAPAANILTNLICFIFILCLWLNGLFPSCGYPTGWSRSLFNSLVTS